MSDEDRHPTEDVELTVSANGAAGTASAESTDDQPTGRPQVELPSQPEASLPSPVAVRDKDKERDSRKDSKDKDRERDSKDKNRERDSSSRRSEKEKDKDRDSSRRKDSRRSRSRDRHSKRRSKSRSASRDRRSKRRSKSRSKSRDRRRSHRSPSRDGGSDRRSKRVSRSRSPDRGRGGSRSKPRASRSRSPRKSTSRGGGSRRSRSSSEEAGGYVPRRRDGSLPASAPAPAAALNPALALPRPLGLLPGNAFQVPPNMATVIAGHATNTDPYAHLRQAAMPTDPNAAARLWQEQQLHARQVVLQQQAAAAAAAATKTQREARRLYVGNLGGAGRVTDMALRQLFNAALMPAFPSSQMPGMEPVVNVSMHSEGRYCFVELRNAEMATAAMQLSGQVQLPGLSGPLTVERPSGYVDPTRAQQAATAAAQALAAFQAGDTAAMTAAATLSASLTGMPNAAAGMPGVPGSLPDLPGLPGGLGMALPGPPALPGGFPGGLPGPPPLPPPVAPPADALSSEPTAYLCVTGVVTASVLKDDRDYDDVKDELLDECGRHAPSGVVEVKVPRPPNPSSVDAVFGTGHYGRAFVHFADAEGAGKARDAIHGRLFAGITVQAVYITQAAYQGVEA